MLPFMHHTYKLAKSFASCVKMLENIPEAPQLPASYPAMMLLSLFPGIFFDVMDPRVMQTASKRADKALLE